MNKMTMTVCSILLVMIVLTVTSCATAGRQFDRTHVNEITKDLQTKEQIKAWFGEPYQITSPLLGHPAGCVERWIYVHSYSSHGGLKAESSSLVVDFDKKGSVCDHAYSEQR